MRDIAVRILINAIAILATAKILPGLHVSDEIVPLLLVAAIFSVVNAFIKPVLKLLTCPVVLLTLGLFILVINGIILELTAWAAGDAFDIDSFWWAILGGIVMALCNIALEIVLGKRLNPKKK